MIAAPAAAQEWTDITRPLFAQLKDSGLETAWPGGCSGVVVNRLTGVVTVKVVGLGLWRSVDQGKTWNRTDQDIVSGRDETGWATHADQNAPERMASFSLDGTAGWTTDGRQWKRFADLGRNWDYGSVDWGAAEPKTIIAAKHETNPPGEVYATADGGITWRQLSIHLKENRGQISMVGAMDATTFVYGSGDGIHRSTDEGATWTKVSEANAQTRIPVLFENRHYLGTTNGLVVSEDKGATWQQQGSGVDIWQGPYFGRNAQEMLVVGKTGIFVTRDGGEHWELAAEVKSKESGFLFTPNWFGCYAWDPLNRVVYASSMGNPVYRIELSDR